MNTLDFLKKHVSDIRRIGYGSYAATVTKYGKCRTRYFHDSEVYDRIHFDGQDYDDYEPATGGLTMRQALDFIYSEGGLYPRKQHKRKESAHGNN